MDIQAATTLRDVVAEEGPLSMSALAVKVEWGKGVLAELGNIRKFLVTNKEIFKLVGTTVHLSDKLSMFAKPEAPAEKKEEGTEKPAETSEEKKAETSEEKKPDESKTPEEKEKEKKPDESKTPEEKEKAMISALQSVGLFGGKKKDEPDKEPEKKEYNTVQAEKASSAEGLPPSLLPALSKAASGPPTAVPKLAGAGIRVAPPARLLAKKQDSVSKAGTPLLSPQKRDLDGNPADGPAAKRLTPTPPKTAPKATGSYAGGRLGKATAGPPGGLRPSSASSARSVPYQPVTFASGEPAEEWAFEPVEEDEEEEVDIGAISFVGSCWGVTNEFYLAEDETPGSVSGTGFNPHGDFSVAGKVTTTGYRLIFNNGEDEWPVSVTWSPDGMSIYGVDSKLQTEAYFEVVLPEQADGQPQPAAPPQPASRAPFQPVGPLQFRPRAGVAVPKKEKVLWTPAPKKGEVAALKPGQPTASEPAPKAPLRPGQLATTGPAPFKRLDPKAATPGARPFVRSGSAPPAPAAGKAEPRMKPQPSVIGKGGASPYSSSNSDIAKAPPPSSSAAGKIRGVVKPPVVGLGKGSANASPPPETSKASAIVGKGDGKGKAAALRRPDYAPKAPLTAPSGAVASRAPVVAPKAPLGAKGAALGPRAPVVAPKAPLAGASRAPLVSRVPVAPKATQAAKAPPLTAEDNLMYVTTERLEAPAGKLAELLQDVGCQSVGDFRGMLNDVPVEELCSALLEADDALDHGQASAALRKMAVMVGHQPKK